MIDIKKYIADSISKIKENPGTMFGFLYPYVLTVIVIVGLYYSSNLENVAKQKVPVLLPDTTIVQDLKVVTAKTIPPVDIKKVSEPSAEILELGKQLYTNTCASCHNESGAGGGPASVGLNPAPRNFTSSDGWKNGRTITGIYTTLEDGIEGTSMISYDFLTPEEKIALAHYIRKEFISNPPETSLEEFELLDQTYNLSAGTHVPAQIPVKSAKEIIINEGYAKLELVQKTINTINNDSEKRGSVIFLSVTSNKELAVSSLVKSSDWKSGRTDFIRSVSKNINTNGFNGNVLLLSESEQNELYNYLVNLL